MQWMLAARDVFQVGAVEAPDETSEDILQYWVKWGRNLTYQNVYKVIRGNGKVSILGPSEAIGNAGVKWEWEFGQHRKWWCGEAVVVPDQSVLHNTLCHKSHHVTTHKSRGARYFLGITARQVPLAIESRRAPL